MNNLGVIFAGGVFRVTVFATIGTVLAILLRRRGPAVGTLLKLTTLSGLVALSVFSIGQGPTFWRIDAVLPTPETPPVPASEPNTREFAQAQPATESWLASFAREFAAEWKSAEVDPLPQQPTVFAESSRWRWPAWLALAMLTAWCLAAVRLALAMVAVRGLCRRCEPIDDVELRDEIDILRAELCVARPIQPRECLELTTPATVGWRNPVILLPENWREWTPIERKAVLAHEIAHVQRGDYLSGLWAQVCLALHAYHPLAHWLVSQLRLDQELAADAAGAALTGGNRLYLESLARLALRQSEPPAAWPVRPFLPTRGTFLRRIEMLRDPKAFQIKPLGAISRAAAVVLLGAAAIGLAGLRGPGEVSAESTSPGGETPVSTLAPTPNQDGKLADVFDLSHVPASFSAVIMMRPAETVKQPGFEGLVKLMKESQAEGRPGSLDVAIEEIEAMAVYGKLIGDNNAPPVADPYTYLIQTTVPQDWKKATRQFFAKPEGVNYNGRTYIRGEATSGQRVYAIIGDRAFLYGPEESVKEFLDAQAGPKIAHAWDGSWSKLNQSPWNLAMVVETKGIENMLSRIDPNNGVMNHIGPMITESKAYSMSLSFLNKGTELRAETIADSADSAQNVDDTTRALLVLAKNLVVNSKRKTSGKTDPGSQHMAQVFDLVEPLLKNAKLAKEGENLSLTAKSDTDTLAIAKTLLPVVNASRTAARRTQSMNNIKMIGLAMHNYADVNGHFPPASVIAPGSKFPHSWRVALLPYLDANDLYKEYDFNEPWDSPRNLKLIPKMPAVLAHPKADPTLGNTAYFVFHGPDSIFPPNSKGTPLQKITDGTSNTILAIECQREVPWTKPEDIDYDPKNFPGPAIPELKPFAEEGFVSLFADGSARFLKKAITPSVLKALISRAGGEVIDYNTF